VAVVVADAVAVAGAGAGAVADLLEDAAESGYAPVWSSSDPSVASAG